MSKHEIKANSDDLYNTIISQIKDDSVTEVTYKINKKKGIMSISGKGDNGAFRATKELYGNSGSIQSTSLFNTDIDREEKKRIVHEMYKNGYKQQQIADMLGISQSQVSLLLNS